MELTQVQVDAGFVLISTSPEQADWNERWARAYRDLQDAAHEVNIFSLVGTVDETRSARAKLDAAQARLDALDLEID